MRQVPRAACMPQNLRREPNQRRRARGKDRKTPSTRRGSTARQRSSRTTPPIKLTARVGCRPSAALCDAPRRWPRAECAAVGILTTADGELLGFKSVHHHRWRQVDLPPGTYQFLLDKEKAKDGAFRIAATPIPLIPRCLNFAHMPIRCSLWRDRRCGDPASSISVLRSGGFPAVLVGLST